MFMPLNELMFMPEGSKEVYLVEDVAHNNRKAHLYALRTGAKVKTETGIIYAVNSQEIPVSIITVIKPGQIAKASRKVRSRLKQLKYA